MKLVALILARSRSDRFPNKVIAELDGTPMIGHIIKSLRKVKRLNDIILLTTGLEEDNRLCELADKYGATGIFRGPETNLLARKLQCLKLIKATHYMTISGDSPFIDIGACQHFVNEFMKQEDYDIDEFNPIAFYANVGATPFGGGIESTRKCEYFDEYFRRHSYDYKYMEHYWTAANDPDYAKEIKPLIKEAHADMDRYMPRETTPIKTSIDYPLELAFWNKAIKLYGKFPKTTDDIYDMFRTIKEI